MALFQYKITYIAYFDSKQVYAWCFDPLGETEAKSFEVRVLQLQKRN